MPKLPILSGKDLVKILSKIGYKHIRTRGSHMVMIKQTENGKKTIPVPNHKEIANITIKQTKGDSLYFEGVNNSQISYLNINDSGNRLIYVHNSRNLIIQNINGYRARVDGFVLSTNENMTIINNSLYELGMVGKPIKSYGGIYMPWVNNTLLQYNSLFDMGYLGIWVTGKDNIIDRNLVNRTCINLDDCGSIYSQLSNLSANIISNNIVIDSIGNPPMKKAGIGSEAGGIYLDDFSSKFSIINNTIINVGKGGIYLHNAFNNTVIGNTVFNAGLGAILILENSPVPGEMHDNNISNNIFHTNFTSTVNPPGSFLGTLGGSLNFGTLDYNYYSHPYMDNIAIKFLNKSIITWDDYVTSYFPFSYWQQETTWDIHSYDIGDFYKINNNYTVNSYGSEGIANIDFNSSINNWVQYPPDYQENWVSNCSIGNGGCLLAIHNDSESLTHLVYSSSFPLIQGQQYELRFKIRGNNNTNSIIPIIRRNAPPYDDLGFRTPRLILKNNETINYSTIFTGITNVSNARFDIEFAENGTSFWIDDVHVTQVNSINSHNQSNDFLLLYNTQTTPQTYNFNNNYMDLSGNAVLSPVTLQPYSSMLLLAGFCNYDSVCNNKETYSTCPSDCPATVIAGTGAVVSGGGGITIVPGQYVYEGWEVIFEFNNISYTISLENIANNTATIEISGGNKNWNFMLGVNETKKVDLNNDSVYDLKISLGKIIGKKVYITANTIQESINPPETTTQIIKEVPEKITKEQLILIIILLVIIIIILLSRRTKIREEKGIQAKKIYIPKKDVVKNFKLDLGNFFRKRKLERLYRKKVRQQRRMERRNLRKPIWNKKEYYHTSLQN